MLDIEYNYKLTGYKLLKKLGEGTSGEVWKVEKENQVYALKMYKPGFESKVFEEFETMLKIEHPNIVDEYEVGTFESRPCMAMEYLEGSPLTEINPNDLSEEQQEKIIASLASALQSAHEQNVIHRDLKPDNIFLLDDGTVKILDFGVSAPISYSPHTKIVAGSYSYMSPEQLSGKVNFQGDIWSFGVCLYEWYTGIHPYQSESLEELSQKMLLLEVESPIYHNPMIPKKIGYVILNCLRKRLDDRYSSFNEVLEDLQSDPVQQLKASFKGKRIFRKNIVEELTTWLQIQHVAKLLMLFAVGGIIIGILSFILIAVFEIEIDPRFGKIFMMGIITSFIIIFSSAGIAGLARRYNVFKSKDFLILSLLANKDKFFRFLTIRSKDNSNTNLEEEVKIHEFLLKWFFKEGDMKKAEKFSKYIKRQNFQNEISLAYQLKQDMESNNFEQAQIIAQKLLSINPSHSAAMLSEKVLSEKTDPQLPVSNQLQLEETQQREPSVKSGSDYQSMIARKIIREGSCTLELLTGKMNLLENRFEIEKDDKDGKDSKDIIDETLFASYKEIAKVRNNGQELIILEESFGDQIKAEIKNTKLQNLALKHLDAETSKNIRFKELSNAKLWNEFLQEKIKGDLKSKSSSLKNQNKKPSTIKILLPIVLKICLIVFVIVNWGDSIFENSTSLLITISVIAGLAYGAWEIGRELWTLIINHYYPEKSDERSILSEKDSFFRMYNLLVEHYINAKDRSGYKGNMNMNPMSFDFENEILHFEVPPIHSFKIGNPGIDFIIRSLIDSTLLYFKKKRQLNFSEIESITFLIDDVGKCVFNEGSNTKIAFLFKKTDYKKYIPILSAFWGDKINFEYNHFLKDNSGD